VSSVVLDLSIMRKAARKRFMADFAEHLYHLKGRAGKQSPLHVVMDEADRFAPQKPQPEFMRLLGAIEDWVRLGRSRGFGITMISQRAALTNKDVLTQVETLIVLRTTSPQDRKAISAWVEENASPEEFQEIAKSLSSLPNGNAWVWSPLLSILKKVEMRRINTFDSMATPKIGHVKAEPKKMAPVDLDALKGRISATIEQAKANDPRTLRARIAVLEVEAKKRNLTPDVKALSPKTVEIPVLKDAQVKRIEKSLERASGLESNLLAALEMVRGIVKEGQEVLRTIGVEVGKSAMFNGKDLEMSPRTTRITFRVDPKIPPDSWMLEGRPIKAPSENGLSGGKKRIVDAMAWLETVRARPANKKQIGLLAGFRPSGTFDTYISDLKKAGVIEAKGDGLLQIAEGFGIKRPATPLTSEQMQSAIMAKINPAQQRMLRTIIGSYPNQISRDELAAAIGMARSGTFDTYLSELSTINAIEVVGRGMVKASDIIFLEAVPV